MQENKSITELGRELRNNPTSAERNYGGIYEGGNLMDANFSGRSP